jgi:lysophospholipase L1-like esterase
VAFDATNGMQPTAGSVSFTNFTGNAALTYEGQIVVKAQKNGCCEYDESNQVSGSTGINRAAGVYLVSTENSGGTDSGHLFLGADNTLRTRCNAGDTVVTKSISSSGKGDYVELCYWWKGTEFGLLADGAPVNVGGVRTAIANVFYKIVVGAAWNGTTAPFGAYYLKDLVVSRIAPRLQLPRKCRSIGFFGDSFVTASILTAPATPLYDATVGYTIQSEFAKAGLKVRLGGSGNSGYTVCDATSNLSTVIAAFAAQNWDVAVIMAGNNDASASDAQVNHVTTGTDAKYKDFITQIVAGNDQCRKIIVTTSGSLRQYTALDTAANNARKVIVDASVAGLPAWWDAANPTNTGLVEVVDLFKLLGGDANNNSNYQGYWNSVGNVTVAAVAEPDNRHPSSFGYVALGREIARVALL